MEAELNKLKEQNKSYKETIVQYEKERKYLEKVKRN